MKAIDWVVARLPLGSVKVRGQAARRRLVLLNDSELDLIDDGLAALASKHQAVVEYYTREDGSVEPPPGRMQRRCYDHVDSEALAGRLRRLMGR